MESWAEALVSCRDYSLFFGWNKKIFNYSRGAAAFLVLFFIFLLFPATSRSIRLWMCTHLKIVPPVLSLFSFNNNKIKTKGLLWIRQVLSFIFMGDKTTGDIAWKIVRTDNPWKRRENFFSSIFFSRLKKYDWTSPWSMAMGIFRATFKKKITVPPFVREWLQRTVCVVCMHALFLPSFGAGP